MPLKKLLIVLPAALIVLVGLLLLSVGIKMVTENSLGHRDFTEGLMLLIPSAVGIVIVIIVVRLLLKSDWAQGSRPGELCCPKCGYNMAGLSATKCPECGAEFTIDKLMGK